MMVWTQYLIALFYKLKFSIISSPVLSRFDPVKSTFLRTDWSAEGMGWITTKPANNEESQKATTHLKKTGECLFQISKHGSRLKPVAFEPLSFNNMESK